MAALSSKKIVFSLVFLITLIGTGSIQAQDTELFHDVPDLGISGSNLELAVSTSPLKKGSYRLEALITKDGKSFPATFDKIEKTSLGRNAYVFSIVSPEKDLSYQFFIRDGNNTLLAKSVEFSNKRDCTTNTSPTYLMPADEREKVEQLATKAILLEAEIKELHEGYRLLSNLKESLDAK